MVPSLQGPLAQPPHGDLTMVLGTICYLRKGDYRFLSSRELKYLPRIKNAFVGVPIIKTVVFSDTSSGRPIEGNYHVESRSHHQRSGPSVYVFPVEAIPVPSTPKILFKWVTNTCGNSKP